MYDPAWITWLPVLIAAWAFMYLLWRLTQPEEVERPYDWSRDIGFLASLHPYEGGYDVIDR